MIDPENSSATACHLLLGHDGQLMHGCIGRECSAFRWMAWNPDDVSLQTHVMGPEESVRNMVEHNFSTNLKVVGYCGLVGLT